MPRGVLTYIFHSSKFQKWIFGTLVCFGRALTQISWIGPIMSYLWMMRLFSCGANHPQVFSQRRSSPLDSVFDTCGSASSSHCFNVGETEHSYLFAFAKAHAFSAKKRMYCNLDARWHMFLQFVPDVWPMQIQNYNHDSTISKKTSWFATFQVMWRTIPPQTIMGYFFSWGLMYVYALVNSPPMEIIFLLPDICTRKVNNFEICCTIFS